MRGLVIQLFIALITWAIWLLFTDFTGLKVILDNITIALTMLLGSFVAGSTSVGGGAVAFPIFTKVLHIDSNTALIFSLAIQSVGMTAASLMIVLTKMPICFRIIRYSVIAGGLGLLTSLFVVRLHISNADIKYLFSCFSFLVASGLIWTRLNYSKISHIDNPKPAAIPLTISCFVGGLLSGIIGTGIDFILFTLMIFLWHYDFKKAIATSVVIMAINALIGFTAILLATNQFSETIMGYWLAAVPIVVVGAPLGALACKYIHKNIMLYFLLSLILIDIVSTIVIMGIKPNYLIALAVIFMACIYYKKRQNLIESGNI